MIFQTFVRGATIILIVSLLMYAAGLLRGQFSNAFKKTDENKQFVIRILEDISVFVLRVIMLTIGLSSLGIDVSSIVGLASVATVSIGQAFQDLATNLVAGFLLILYGKMKEGDYIQFIFEEQQLEGEVIDIGIRTSTLRKDNDILHVPNGIIFNGVFGVKPAVDIE